FDILIKIPILYNENYLTQITKIII
ncbi:MAG: hypothetical protein UZ11_BCD004000229, partial [Bacteroidetes bacterium OLB11]